MHREGFGRQFQSEFLNGSSPKDEISNGANSIERHFARKGQSIAGRLNSLERGAIECPMSFPSERRGKKTADVIEKSINHQSDQKGKTNLVCNHEFVQRNGRTLYELNKAK